MEVCGLFVLPFFSASSLLGESATAGGTTNTLQMQEALRPHLGKLLPRVLRAKHDPNKQTREQSKLLLASFKCEFARVLRHVLDSNFQFFQIN